MTGDVTSQITAQLASTDSAKIQSPVYYINADGVQFSGQILHSTPETAEQRDTVHHSIEDVDAEYLNLMHELPVIMNSINGRENRIEPEDSGVVQVGHQTGDSDGDLPTTLLWTEDRSEDSDAEPFEVSVIHQFSHLKYKKKTRTVLKL